MSLRIARWLCCFLPLVQQTAFSADQTPVPAADVLPATKPLQLPESLDVVMVQSINRYAEQQLALAREQRQPDWLADAPDTPSGQAARQAARNRLRDIAGLPRQLNESPILQLGLPGAGGDLPWGEAAGFVVSTCSWDSYEGVTGQGLIAIPRTEAQGTSRGAPLIVVIPDADQTPEQLFGLAPGLEPQDQLAKVCAAQGCIVLCPVLINRQATWSGHPHVRQTNLSHREFLYRLSFELGLHPAGFEVAKILTGIQAVQRHFNRKLQTAVVGIGEGGLIGLLAGAIDADAVNAVEVRGYFNQREEVWKEPIYRNFYGMLREFGDAEIASLIAPRPLIINAGAAPEVAGLPTVEGLRDICAPGSIRTPDEASVQAEFERAAGYYAQAGKPDAIQFISSKATANADSAQGHVLSAALMKALSVTDHPHLADSELAYQKSSAGSELFQNRRMQTQLEELEHYAQRILEQSQFKRDELWKPLERLDVAEYERSSEKFRTLVHQTFIGQLPEMTAPFNARSRKIIDEPTHVGYEIVLDCYPDPSGDTSKADGWGVIAGGVLLIPKNLQAGEHRPVIVFQHGLEGVPADTLTLDQKDRGYQSYKGISTKLALQGFIVYAPQNPYRGMHEFRVIQRKSNPLGRSLFSYIVEQHRQTLGWLATLPYVDDSRIAFYGLSYGGKTAMRVPAMLPPREGAPGYCLSICSADFNDWIRKNCSGQDRYSYVYTYEYEIFEWNMAHIANYAELSHLILPRPFMVERGLDDAVAPDDWVAAEYARVRRPYLKMGIGDQTEMEVFDGPHTINEAGTIDFLKKHLSWSPQP